MTVEALESAFKWVRPTVLGSVRASDKLGVDQAVCHL